MPTAKIKKSREHRINRIAKKFALSFRLSRTKGNSLRTFVRKERKRAKLAKIVAYDFETTRIAKGTPRPLFLTAYGDGGVDVAEPVNTPYDILEILNRDFLTLANNRAKFVAWNGNNFDAYFIAMALLHSKDYIIRPYLTRSKNLRGIKVIPNDPVLAKSVSWEFLDGIAMLGVTGKTLAAFLKQFAPPEFQKLTAPDWANEEFDPDNADHVDYAVMDSVGLYHGLKAAQGIVAEHFNIGLSGTIGNMGIKIFQSFIPEGVKIREPRFDLHKIIKQYVMRGGYCVSMRKYRGPVWKYDLNQAYAAAMRDAKLPAGVVYHMPGKVSQYAKAYIVRVTATNPRGEIPFYYRDIETNQTRFDAKNISDTWLTSIEHKQLLAEGWRVNIVESYYWDETFDMREYVNKLEFLRVGAGRDPKSAQGEMIKAIGNNSYGKTVEQLDGIELLIANEQPEGYSAYYTDDDKLQHVWFRFLEPDPRDYHQPQLGAFITAHVRMVVRRAALLNPKAFIYADTDCVVFTQYVPLECDAKKYGFWKVESEGVEHMFITKKVYAKSDGSEKHAKGLNRNSLSIEDFQLWFDGKPPTQTQTQKNNFVKVMTGAAMFGERTKRGEIIKNS